MTTPLPTPPNTIRPETFAAEMDDFLGALPTFQAELDALGSAFALSVTSTSATSLTVGTGSQSLTVQAGKGYLPGMDVAIAHTTTPATRMIGIVTSYDSTTGSLVVGVLSASGSGTQAAWTISPATIVSFDGQTYTDLRLSGKITETIYSLSGTAINPANGSIQTKTLAANTTFTESLASGNSLVLHITAGSYTVTWPTMTWLWGSAPTLPASGQGVIVLWKVGSTLFGVYAGSAV